MNHELDFDEDASALTAAEAERRAGDLRAELQRHAHLYYVEARPELSDEEYDRLFRRLQELEAAHPAVRTLDSPTQRVGAEPQAGFLTVEHAAPMLSLDSTQDPEEVRRFDERVRKALGEGVEPTYLLEPKLDGASIELVYEGGVFVRAVTRGNGRRGEQITENIRTIPSVPLRLRTEERPAPALLALRGEVMMYISDFEAFNKRLVEGGREPYASPRNSAAGAVRQLDSTVTASRRLDLLVYDVLAAEGASFTSDAEGIQAVRQWGFKVPERVQVAHTVEQIIDYHARFGEDRDRLDYEIDGVVIKLDDTAGRAAMGSTSHHPRWALAYKFEPRKEVTRLESIGVQVGRTGVLTPVAFLRPVVVGGVTISRASLHNREELERKDIREGDTVRIQRAGDVIPQVVEVVAHEEERARPFVMPTHCPACGAPTRVDGPRTVCPNRFACPAQLKGRIVHYGARDALDIEGLGEETAQLLVDRSLVRSLSDLYDLTPDELTPLPGFAEKSATALVDAVRSRSEPELRRFLVALGIPEVGVTVARDMASHFGRLDAVLDATPHDLEEIAGIGPRMSEAITDFLAEERNRAAIEAIRSKGVVPEEREPVRRDSGSGQAVVFTGSLPVSRSVVEECWRAVGGRPVSSVSKKTDFVVAGANAGSKLTKAEKLGVPVIGYEEFVSRLLALGGQEPQP